MIKLNIRYTLQTPEGMVSETGIKLILDYIRRQTPMNDSRWSSINPTNERNFVPLPTVDFDWRWMVTDGELKGSLPKRIRKYYYKTYGLNVPAEILSEIGNIARAHTETQTEYRFDFVNEFDWDEGEFGDDGSCYWTDRSHARAIIRDNGGMAIRFFDSDGYGFARAWVAPIDDNMYIVFNGYGFAASPTLTIARILAWFLGLSYKSISLKNHGTGGGTLWINGDIGYLVASLDKLSITRYDLRWDNFYATCHNCYDTIDEHDVYIGADSETYCEHCYYELFDHCEQCGQTYYSDDMLYVANEMICLYCRNRHYVQCSQCDDYIANSAAIRVKGVIYCEDCIE